MASLVGGDELVLLVQEGDSTVIGHWRREAPPERRFVDLDRGPIKIYGLPEKGAFYIIVADVAEGGPDAEDKDNDRSAAIVMDYRTGKVMAVFAGYWEPARSSLSTPRTTV